MKISPLLCLPLGECDAGFICFTNAVYRNPVEGVSWGRLCAAGFYCPQGTTIEVPCPEGRYK